MAWTLPDDCVLGIIGARPESGPDPNPAADAWGARRGDEVREAMLFDTLDFWDSDENLSPGGRRVLVYAPGDAGPWFDERVPSSFALQPQIEGDIGTRIQEFLAGELEDAGRVVVIGCDTPTLDPSIVVGAFLCLEGRDVVLGPATGGGFYLVGARRPMAPILGGIDPVGPDTLDLIVDRLVDSGRSLAVLPPWYRVATPAEFRMLAGHVRAMRRAGRDPGVPRLERLIQGLRTAVDRA